MGFKSIIKNFILFGSSVAIIGSGVGMSLSNSSTNGEIVSINCTDIDDDFEIGAHRGFSSLAVENSLLAFELAKNVSYIDYIEMDARLTKDKRIVLSHDSTLGNNKIEHMTYSEIINSQYRYFSNDFQIDMDTLFSNEGFTLLSRYSMLNGDYFDILSLEEGIKACGDKKIILDLKFQDNILEFVEMLNRQFNGCDTSNIIFQSDDATALLYLKSVHPEWFCSLLVRDENDFALVEYFDGIGIRKNIVNKSFVDNAISQGKLVLVWTLKSTNEVSSVCDKLGDACDDVVYITDYPDIIYKHLIKNYNDK